MNLTEEQQKEALIVGSVLISGEIRPDVRFLLKPHHFTHEKLKQTYLLAVELYEENGKVDYSLIMEKLREMKIIDLDFLVDLHWAEEEAVTRVRQSSMARALLREYERKSLKDACYDVGSRITEGIPIELARNQITESVFKSTITKGKEISNTEHSEILYSLIKKKERKDVFCPQYGWPHLDRVSKGMVPGEITLLSGPSGSGKTTTALNWMTNASVCKKHGGLFVSLEMDENILGLRILASLSGENINMIESGKITQNVDQALKILNSEANYTIIDNTPKNMTEIVAAIELSFKNKAIEFFVLDYIGEVLPDRHKDERSDQMYRRWIKTLRDLCVRLKIHGVIICQNNKEGDLAESKAMAHVSDRWFHFFVEEKQPKLIVRKNRNGPVGSEITLFFDKKTQTIRETDQ